MEKTLSKKTNFKVFKTGDYVKVINQNVTGKVNRVKDFDKSQICYLIADGHPGGELPVDSNSLVLSIQTLPKPEPLATENTFKVGDIVEVNNEFYQNQIGEIRNIRTDIEAEENVYIFFKSRNRGGYISPKDIKKITDTNTETSSEIPISEKQLNIFNENNQEEKSVTESSNTELTESNNHDKLKIYEDIIEKGVRGFLDAGKALKIIQTDKLYRLTHTNFQDYCRDRWNLSRAQAYSLIDAVKVVEDLEVSLSAVADIQGEIILPTSERQTRALKTIESSEERAEVWQEVVKETGGKPTGKAVEKKVKQNQADKLPKPEPAYYQKFQGHDNEQDKTGLGLTDGHKAYLDKQIEQARNFTFNPVSEELVKQAGNFNPGNIPLTPSEPAENKKIATNLDHDSLIEKIASFDDWYLISKDKLGMILVWIHEVENA